VGFLARRVGVRAQNLPAWVEADFDGPGFQVFDPTPRGGVPPVLRPYSLLSRVSALGREVEFFYDRHVLGFDSGDQSSAVEAARESLAQAAGKVISLRESVREAFSPAAAAGFLAAALVGWLLWRAFRRVSDRRDPSTRAYLALRRIALQRGDRVVASTPPAEVVRLFSRRSPEGAEDARAVVETYCASAFGGIAPGPEAERELRARLRRLKRIS
ncbi:MAG: DUF4129 domain-containing protein, partial [Syntrophomonadaceae bacterium]